MYPNIRKNPEQRGFALVITLSLMVLLTILAVGLMSLSAISLRSSTTGDDQAQAYANARMAVMLALGQLQKHAGDDRRITADASIETSVSQGHLVGVFNSWTHNFVSQPDKSISSSQYTTQKNNNFRTWLASNPDREALENRDFASTSPSQDWIKLFTVEKNGFELSAQPLETETGALAWVVSQENTKAKVNVGVFKLNGKEYTLATNNEPGGIPCHLHGGKVGFNKRMWKAEPDEKANAVAFTYVSPDGEEGYPGTLTTKVTYTLTEANELKWEVSATTDAPTVLNIVHHSYWNLSGDPKTTINDHILMLDADKYLPTDAGLIPTGKLDPVAGTPMDFTKPTAIGDRVEADFEALKLGGGYDHAWVLTPKKGIRLAARLKDPKSGRVLEISTDKPAVQFYGGNFLDGKVAGKKGEKYAFRTACCLETENFPDAPNHPEFPSAVLKPGETYTHTMVHKFLAE